MAVAGCFAVLLTALASTVATMESMLVLWLAWAGYAVVRGHMFVMAIALRRLLALRWFLIALVILHGVGAWLAPPNARLDLLLDGLRQVLVLATLVSAVTIVLEPLSLNQRIEAIEGLLLPLRPLGVDPERIGRLLATALHDAFSMRKELMEEARTASERVASQTSRVNQVIDIVAQRCLAIERRPAEVDTGVR